MATIVVNIFLPHTVDFHEFDDEPRPTPVPGKHPSSSKSSSHTNLAASQGKKSSVEHLLGGEGELATPASPAEQGPTRASLPPLRRDDDSTALISALGLTGARAQELTRVRHAEDAAAGRFAPVAAAAAAAAAARTGTEDAHGHAFARSPQHPPSWLRTDTHLGHGVESEMQDQPSTRLDSVVSGHVTGDVLRNTSRTDLNHLDVPEQMQKPHDISPPAASIKASASTSSLWSLFAFDESKWTVAPPILTNGGLVNAIRKSAQGASTDTIWIGTLSGNETDRISKETKENISAKFDQEYACQPLYLADETFKQWYEHYCKLVLWPIMHYQQPDHQKSPAVKERSFPWYKLANEIFANKVIETYKAGDTIWVHDYHLLLVPGLVRQKIPDAKIGLFLHAPFPSPEIWRDVCPGEDVLAGMLGANLVALQTGEHAEHFLQCCSRLLVTETTPDGVFYRGRFTNVIAQPIAFVHEVIDEELSKDYEQIQVYIDEIHAHNEGKKLIIARDKLDNVRGIRQKLLAYECFLAKYPDLRQKVKFLQIATSTTELVEMQTTIWDIVTRINDQYGTLGHRPIQVFLQDMPFDRYVAMIAAGDIMLITSLREGMGLTAQEYVYCQDGTICRYNKHGPIILSEFTGTSELFVGNDLSCNPWDIDHTAELIQQALVMSPEEKEERWSKLRQIVDSHTGGEWFLLLQKRLDFFHAEQSARLPANIPRLVHAPVVESYRNTFSRLMILDHEDTVATVPPNPATFCDLKQALRTLATSYRNEVWITSDLEPDELMAMYHDVPELGLIASNGCFVRGPYASDWKPASCVHHVESWKREIARPLKAYLKCIKGYSFVEETTRLIIDYTKAENSAGAHAIIGNLCSFVNLACSRLGVRAVPYEDYAKDTSDRTRPEVVRKCLIIETFEATKLSAVQDIVEERRLPGLWADWILVAGDGREDEPVMKYLRELKYTEEELASRRDEAGKGPDKSRAALVVSTKKQQKRPVTFGVGPEEDEDDDDYESLERQLERLQGPTTTVHKKITSALPPDHVWTVSLGQPHKETHAQNTLAGGPAAMVALLTKLAHAETELDNAGHNSDWPRDDPPYDPHDDPTTGSDTGPSPGNTGGERPPGCEGASSSQNQSASGTGGFGAAQSGLNTDHRGHPRRGPFDPYENQWGNLRYDESGDEEAGDDAGHIDDHDGDDPKPGPSMVPLVRRPWTRREMDPGNSEHQPKFDSLFTTSWKKGSAGDHVPTEAPGEANEDYTEGTLSEDGITLVGDYCADEELYMDDLHHCEPPADIMLAQPEHVDGFVASTSEATSTPEVTAGILGTDDDESSVLAPDVASDEVDGVEMGFIPIMLADQRVGSAGGDGLEPFPSFWPTPWTKEEEEAEFGLYPAEPAAWNRWAPRKDFAGGPSEAPKKEDAGPSRPPTGQGSRREPSVKWLPIKGSVKSGSGLALSWADSNTGTLVQAPVEEKEAAFEILQNSLPTPPSLLKSFINAFGGKSPGPRPSIDEIRRKASRARLGRSDSQSSTPPSESDCSTIVSSAEDFPDSTPEDVAHFNVERAIDADQPRYLRWVRRETDAAIADLKARRLGYASHGHMLFSQGEARSPYEAARIPPAQGSNQHASKHFDIEDHYSAAHYDAHEARTHEARTHEARTHEARKWKVDDAGTIPSGTPGEGYFVEPDLERPLRIKPKQKDDPEWDSSDEELRLRSEREKAKADKGKQKAKEDDERRARMTPAEREEAGKEARRLAWGEVQRALFAKNLREFRAEEARRPAHETRYDWTMPDEDEDVFPSGTIQWDGDERPWNTNPWGDDHPVMGRGQRKRKAMQKMQEEAAAAIQADEATFWREGLGNANEMGFPI